MKTALLAIFALFALALPALAQREPPEPAPLPAGVTNREISVTSEYSGAQVTIFGYNPAANRGGDIVVVLRGPDRSARLMRKRPILGLWINGDPVTFSAAPAYFAVYATRPLGTFLDQGQIWRYRLNPAALAQLDSATPADADPGDYRRALVRLKTDAGLYRTVPGGVQLREDGIFTADVAIPANAPIGLYTAQAYVFRNGLLISVAEDQVVVERRGFERRVYDLAHNQSLLYGLTAVLLAAAFGWTAAAIFRRS
jgi:uncharacterized protein (TIGR02186 family)